MIELRRQPVFRDVAIRTLLAEPTVMVIVFEVAVNAALGRRPVFLIRSVAVFTVHLDMASRQREIGDLVIKGFRVEPNDVGVATYVFRVASGAGLLGNLCGQTVKTDTGADIARNILMVMAIEAQLALFIAGESGVTRRTGGLDIGMAGNYRAGHNERLDIRGGGLGRVHTEKRRHHQ